LFNEFQRCGLQLYDQRPEESEWDWYFLMQNHGAPTRLLDWSDGAPIALHFALKDKKQGDPQDAFVYVIESDHRNSALVLVAHCNALTFNSALCLTSQVNSSRNISEGSADQFAEFDAKETV